MRRLVSVLLAVAVLATPTMAADPLRGGHFCASADPDIPSYVLSFNVAPVAAMDILEAYVAGGISKVVRLRRVVLVNPGNATAAATVDVTLGLATGSGSGGTAPAMVAVDQSSRSSGVTGGPDASVAGVVVTHLGDTTQATGFTAVYSPLATVSIPATAGGFTPLTIYDARDPPFKGMTVSVGGQVIIVLRIAAVGAGATGFRGYAEFTVTDA